MLITGAREQAEILQGRDLIRKQWDLSIDYWSQFSVFLRAPLISVDLAQYKTSAGVVTPMVENTDFIVDTNKQPGMVIPPYNKTWPIFAPCTTSRPRPSGPAAGRRGGRRCTSRVPTTARSGGGNATASPVSPTEPIRWPGVDAVARPEG